MRDSDIIQGLESEKKQFDQALGFLFSSLKYRTPIFQFFFQKGLKKQDAETLWTDIVIKFSTLVKNGKYQHQNNLLGYLKNLSNYMLLNFFRSNKKYTNQIELDQTIPDPVIAGATLHHMELKETLKGELNKIGDTCAKVLLMWAESYSMSEIQSELNFISPEATRKRKHNCLKKLLDSVRSNHSMMELLEDYKNVMN